MNQDPLGTCLHIDDWDALALLCCQCCLRSTSEDTGPPQIRAVDPIACVAPVRRHRIACSQSPLSTLGADALPAPQWQTGRGRIWGLGSPPSPPPAVATQRPYFVNGPSVWEGEHGLTPLNKGNRVLQETSSPWGAHPLLEGSPHIAWIPGTSWKSTERLTHRRVGAENVGVWEEVGCGRVDLAKP